MFEDIQLIYVNVKILKFWSLLYDRNWRRYVTLIPTSFLVFTQFYYMFMTDEGIDAIIRNSYMLFLWFNTILRAYILIKDSAEYQRLIKDLETYFYDLKVNSVVNECIKFDLVEIVYILHHVCNYKLVLRQSLYQTAKGMRPIKI